MIREEEPPRPSTRLSDSKEPLASLAAQADGAGQAGRWCCAATWTGS